MGFLDFFQGDKNVIAKTDFIFNDSHVIINQQWLNGITLTNIAFNLVAYVVRYYNICDDRQRINMFTYLVDIHNEKIIFKSNESGVYSHKGIWEIIVDTLNKPEREAIDKAFSYESKAPFLYNPNIDKAFVQHNALKVYTEYRFTFKLVRQIPVNYLKLGPYDKIFLPLSVSVLINKALTDVSESDNAKLLTALGILCFGLSKNGLSDVSKATEIEIMNEIFLMTEN